MKINKSIIISLFITWFTIFLLITNHQVQNRKKDEGYNSLGIEIVDTVDEAIGRSRKMHMPGGFKKVVEEDLSMSKYVYGEPGNYKKINDKLTSSQSQIELNDKFKNMSNIIVKVNNSKSNKTSLIAIPFVIEQKTSSEMYPDEHIISKKGEIGVHRFTEVDNLKREVEIKKPVDQINVVGTKSYIGLPRLKPTISIDYEKVLKSKTLQVKESPINSYPGKGAKKVFMGYSDNNHLDTLKVNSVVDVKIRWLSKKEQDDRKKREEEIKKHKEYERQLEIHIDELKKKISEFKYLKSNRKNDYDNQLDSKNTFEEVDKVYAKAKAEQDKEEEKNGIGTGKYTYPVTPPHITGDTGFHLSAEGVYAIDFSPIGAYPGSHPIVAADSGVVLQASWDGPYGNCAIINHRNGYSTRYGHMNSFTVAPGTFVRKGQQIGWIGTTGNSTGTHVHFEIMSGIKGRTLDPHGFGL